MALANCGDTLPRIAVNGDAPFVSGERLRAQLLDGSAGAEQFVAWWDSALETSCQFHLADDGELRCLPGASAFATSGITPTTLVYTDAACTAEARAVPVGRIPEPYLASEVESSSACGDNEVSIRELGSPIPDMTTWYDKNASGECYRRGPAGTYSFYEVGDHVDASTFVRGAEVRAKRNAELDALVRVADDGASQIIGAVDRKTSKRCWQSRFDSNEDRDSCVPLARAYDFGTYFADSTCSQALAYEPACETATVALAWRYDESGTYLEYFERGAEIPKESVFHSFYRGCEPNPYPAPDDLRYFTLGDPIPESTFPVLTYVRYGLGLVSAVHVADADGGLLTASHFIDRESGQRCNLQVTCDGQRRCITSFRIGVSNSSSYGSFSDPACSEPVASPSCGEDLSDALLDFPAADSCHEDATIGSLHEVGPAYEAQLYHYDEFGACVEQEPESGRCYYERGAAIDLERFAPIIDRIE